MNTPLAAKWICVGAAALLGACGAPGPGEAKQATLKRSVPTSQARATLYQHATHDAHFPGASWVLKPGSCNAGRPFTDDELSAVEVPAGYALHLFRDTDEKGTCMVLREGLHDLAPYGFNDFVSSVRLGRADQMLPMGDSGTYRDVWLHQERLTMDLNPGDAWRLKLESGRASQLFTPVDQGFRADAASTVHVPLGQEVTLFDAPNGVGGALVLGPGIHDLAHHSFSHRVSSVRVRRLEEWD